MTLKREHEDVYGDRRVLCLDYGGGYKNEAIGRNFLEGQKCYIF